MESTPQAEARTGTLSDQTRRKLVKRLALLVAAGYTAPKAILISESWACDKSSKPAPHGQSTTGPFCP